MTAHAHERVDATVGGARPGRTYAASKRALDLAASALLLVVLLPVMLVCALAVRMSGPGPALFRQERVGINGSPFTMLKFRTMTVGNDDRIHREYVTRLLSGPEAPDGGAAGVYKLVSDPRVTPLGRFLRRTSLDELPQLVNVLRGDMSLVGPRPALAWEVAMYRSCHRRRLEVKPGLTGLWQVSGRNSLTMLQALDLDVEYVERRSLRLDVALLVRTIPAMLGRSTAA